MATGWAHEGAVQEQIDATVKDAIERAKSQLPAGPGLLHCAECGDDIPEARRVAMPGVRLCLLRPASFFENVLPQLQVVHDHVA